MKSFSYQPHKQEQAQSIQIKNFKYDPSHILGKG